MHKYKLTLEDCQRIAKERGGECLSDSYTNNKTKMMWKCQKGHRWESDFGHMKRDGSWCPYCANVRPLTITECQKYAESKGGKCLSTEYKNNTTKMVWECEFGHQWKSNFGAVKKSGSWCGFCVGTARLTLKECQDYAINKNGKCLSSEYKNNTTKMVWECAEGHTWKSSFSNMKHFDNWCPYCAHRVLLTLEECQKYAESKNGNCLSSEYKDSATVMLWECKEGHRWEARFGAIKFGHWCPYCAHSISLTLEECQKYAESKGGQCLSTEYKNNTTKMAWECENGHTWKACFSSIKTGHWCPSCKRKTQDKITKIIEQIFCDYTIEREITFSWFKNTKTNHNLLIDIWVPEVKLAIEYDGEHHFRPVRFGGISQHQAEENFKKQIYRDQVKNELILEHPEDVNSFIRFDYTEPLTKDYITEKLKKFGINLGDSNESRI